MIVPHQDILETDEVRVDLGEHEMKRVRNAWKADHSDKAVQAGR